MLCGQVGVKRKGARPRRCALLVATLLATAEATVGLRPATMTARKAVGPSVEGVKSTLSAANAHPGCHR